MCPIAGTDATAPAPAVSQRQRRLGGAADSSQPRFDPGHRFVQVVPDSPLGGGGWLTLPPGPEAGELWGRWQPRRRATVAVWRGCSVLFRDSSRLEQCLPACPPPACLPACLPAWHPLLQASCGGCGSLCGTTAPLRHPPAWLGSQSAVASGGASWWRRDSRGPPVSRQLRGPANKPQLLLLLLGRQSELKATRQGPACSAACTPVCTAS